MSTTTLSQNSVRSNIEVFSSVVCRSTGDRDSFLTACLPGIFARTQLNSDQAEEYCCALFRGSIGQKLGATKKLIELLRLDSQEVEEVMQALTQSSFFNNGEEIVRFCLEYVARQAFWKGWEKVKGTLTIADYAKQFARRVKEMPREALSEPGTVPSLTL